MKARKFLLPRSTMPPLVGGKWEREINGDAKRLCEDAGAACSNKKLLENDQRSWLLDIYPKRADKPHFAGVKLKNGESFRFARSASSAAGRGDFIKRREDSGTHAD